MGEDGWGTERDGIIANFRVRPRVCTNKPPSKIVESVLSLPCTVLPANLRTNFTCTHPVPRTVCVRMRFLCNMVFESVRLITINVVGESYRNVNWFRLRSEERNGKACSPNELSSIFVFELLSMWKVIFFFFLELWIVRFFYFYFIICNKLLTIQISRDESKYHLYSDEIA